jgi:hypothetical protein
VIKLEPEGDVDLEPSGVVNPEPDGEMDPLALNTEEVDPIVEQEDLPCPLAFLAVESKAEVSTLAHCSLYGMCFLTASVCSCHIFSGCCCCCCCYFLLNFSLAYTIYEAHLQDLWTHLITLELELCGGAVTVSFLKYLPWQAKYFLQCSTHFSKTCCRLSITLKFLASELLFHGWKSPEIAWGEI